MMDSAFMKNRRRKYAHNIKAMLPGDLGEEVKADS
jgi:hypothetical protein